MFIEARSCSVAPMFSLELYSEKLSGLATATLLAPTVDPEPAPADVTVIVDGYAPVVVDARLLPPAEKKLKPNCASLERSSSTMRTFNRTCFTREVFTTK